MTPAEAHETASRMHQAGRNRSGDFLWLSASVEEDRLSFEGGLFGPHGLSISCSSVERAVLHWRGYVEASGLTPTLPAPPAPPPRVVYGRGDLVRFPSASASSMGGTRVGEVIRVTPTRLLLGYRFKYQRGQGRVHETWQRQRDVRMVRCASEAPAP